MGIGGLDEQFIQILRRAFASRVFPPEVTEQLGVKHVKGLLLYGPPGMNVTSLLTKNLDLGRLYYYFYFLITLEVVEDFKGFSYFRYWQDLDGSSNREDA